MKGRAARWALTLQGYNFEIKHRPGKENQAADALSRIQPTVAHCDVSGYAPDSIYQRQRRDPELLQLILFLESQEPYSQPVPSEIAEAKSENFFLDEDNLLYKLQTPNKPYDATSLLVVPDSLREEILINCHDSPLAGHFGFEKTYNKIKTHYWWPLMYSQIKDWCATCEPCLKRKRNFGQKVAPLNPIPIGHAFERVGVDCLGPMTPTESGNKYIVVFSDYRTKWVEAQALPSIEASRIAQVFFNLIITRHGSPNTLLSDRGTNFLSKLMHEIYLIMSVKKLTTSSYHPQCDGQVEKFNHTLTQSLAMYCNTHQTNWDTFLPGILFGYRTSTSSSTGESPFVMLYGRQPRLPMDVSLLPPSKLSADQSQYRSSIVKNLAIAQKLATDRNNTQQSNMKIQYDKKAAPPRFAIGQKVMVHDPTKKSGLTKKLAPHYLGPFTIIEQPSPVLVRLDGLGPQKSNIIHVNRLKLCPEPTKHSIRAAETNHEPPQPPPVEPKTNSAEPDIPTNGTPAEVQLPAHNCTVEMDQTNTGNPIQNTPGQPFENPIPDQIIIKHRTRNRSPEYLIHDRNAPPASAVWVKSRDIENTDLLSRYVKAQEQYPATRSKTRLTAPITVLGSTFRPSLYPLYLLITLIVFCIALPLTQGKKPQLGPLYNCDVTQYMGVYTIPNPLNCLDNPSGHEIHSFEAQINQYHPPITKLPLYLCTLHKIILTCSENFFAAKETHITTIPTPFSLSECRRAAYLKTSQYGRLLPSGIKTWKTHTKQHYTCAWLKTKTTVYYALTVTTYTATLQGDNPHIQQTLTVSQCNYYSFYCTPNEQPLSTIVWRSSKHTFTVFTNRGIFPVKQINNFFLIPALGIGGTTIKETGTPPAYLLDTGYQVIQKNKGTFHVPLSFTNYSQQYVKHTKSNTQRDLGQGRVAQQFIHEHEIVTQLAHSLCLANKELRQLQRWILNSFADTASEYLFPEPGKLVETLGEGLLLHSCQTIQTYTIFWNQTFNNTCYTTFPVTSPDLPKLYFLELNKRRLVAQGHKIPCTTNTKLWYVTDKKGALWQLRANRFREVHKYAWAILSNKVELTKIGHFNLQLLHYDEKTPSRLSLLALLSRNKDNLEDLGQFRSEGNGDIISGIGKILGTTISAVAKGGSEIIRSIGAGIRDTLAGVGDLDEKVVGSIGNATANVITTTSTALTRLLSSMGGISGLLLWALVALLYLYLFLMQMQNPPLPFLFPPRTENPPTPISRTVPVPDTPPVPKRQRKPKHRTSHTHKRHLSQPRPTEPGRDLSLKLGV